MKQISKPEVTAWSQTISTVSSIKKKMKSPLDLKSDPTQNKLENSCPVIEPSLFIMVLRVREKRGESHRHMSFEEKR